MRSYIRDFAAYHRDIKLFLLYSLASNVGVGVIMLLYNLYLTTLGYREDFIGTFNSVNTLAMACVSLSMGFLINRFGIWRSVFVGLLVFVGTSLAVSIVTTQTLLLFFAVLSGAGTAFLFVPTMPFIVDLTSSRERHGVAALAFSLNSLSTTIGSLLGGWLPRVLAATTDLEPSGTEVYRFTLLAGIVCAGLAVIPLLAMSEGRKRGRPGENMAPEARADREGAPGRNVRRDMAVFIAIGGLMSLGAGAVFPFYNVFLQTRGANAGQIGLIYSAAGLMAAALGLLSPWLSRRMGSLRAVVFVRLAPAPFYLLLMLTPILPIATFGHMIRTTSINMAWPIDSTYISEILPAQARSRVFGYRSGAWNFGWAISSAIVGRLIVDYGYNVSFGVYVFFMVVAMTTFYVYFDGAARRAARVTANSDASAPDAQAAPAATP